MTSTTNNNSEFHLLSELLAILSGLIGGGRYGIKIRLPHSLVMTLLFGNTNKRKSTSIRDQIQSIVNTVFEHSSNLASFAFVYKTLLFILKWLSSELRRYPHILSNNHNNHHQSLFQRLRRIVVSLLVHGHTSARNSPPNVILPGRPESSYHSALAGFIGGYLIWGRYSSVNNQILLYLTSRILVSCVKLAREKNISPFCWKIFTFKNVYPLKAAIVWGCVMYLFEYYPHVLHPSLKSSMDDIYRYSLDKTENDSRS